MLDGRAASPQAVAAAAFWRAHLDAARQQIVTTSRLHLILLGGPAIKVSKGEFGCSTMRGNPRRRLMHCCSYNRGLGPVVNAATMPTAVVSDAPEAHSAADRPAVAQHTPLEAPGLLRKGARCYVRAWSAREAARPEGIGLLVLQALVAGDGDTRESW